MLHNTLGNLCRGYLTQNYGQKIIIIMTISAETKKFKINIWVCNMRLEMKENFNLRNMIQR